MSKARDFGDLAVAVFGNEMKIEDILKEIDSISLDDLNDYVTAALALNSLLQRQHAKRMTEYLRKYLRQRPAKLIESYALDLYWPRDTGNDEPLGANDPELQ